jgi:Second Messenger Oligonucleotide or Dinucleotide Synthetase domain
VTIASMTVAQAFDQFLRALEITEEERRLADRKKLEIRDDLQERLKPDAVIISGSFGRRTAIRPLNDIDLFIVLSEHIHGALRSQPPQRCIEAVQGALQKAHPQGASIRPQRRSVNVTFPSPPVGYDVVPAFRIEGGIYIIPDLDRENWIRTNPEEHAKLCKEADARAGHVLNRLIKTVKHWNAIHGKQLGSFHIEVMAYDAFRRPPPGLLEGFGQLLAYLAGAVQKACPDPARVGPNIDRGMAPEWRQQLARQLGNAAEKVEQAIALDRQGSVAQAHQILRKLLGDYYPVG